MRFQGAQYCWDAKSCHFREDSNHSSFLTTSKHAPEWISNMLPQDPHIYPWMLKAFGILNVVSAQLSGLILYEVGAGDGFRLE